MEHIPAPFADPGISADCARCASEPGAQIGMRLSAVARIMMWMIVTIGSVCPKEVGR